MRWTRHASTFVFLAACLFGASGCEGEARSSEAYPARIVVESDPGKSVAGATVQRNGHDVATTDPNGAAVVKLAGREGDTIDLNVRCPQGYESPAKPVSVRLTRRGDSKKMPEYTAQCAPTYRNVVVAVRADGGPLMPITYLGRTIARTDEAGAAHILLRMRPGDQFELGLDTSAFPKHHPQSPKQSFLVPSTSDDVQRFDVRFEVEKPRPIVRRAPQGPKRI